MITSPSQTPPEGGPLIPLLQWVCAHPVELLVRRWNWKSAMFSALFRGGIFFTVNLKAGFGAAVVTMLVQFAWRSATSGGFGAVTQLLRKVRPEWQAVLGATLILPGVSHGLEFIISYLAQTPVLGKSVLISICFTQISNLFNLYAMHKGAMIVGSEARPLREDMLRMPVLIGGFVLVLPRLVVRLLNAFRNEGA